MSNSFKVLLISIILNEHFILRSVSVYVMDKHIGWNNVKFSMLSCTQIHFIVQWEKDMINVFFTVGEV